MNNRKKRLRGSKSPNQDNNPRECDTDPNTSDVKSFEDLMENVDILYHLAYMAGVRQEERHLGAYNFGNPLSLLIGILPKVSKRCGAAAEQALVMLVEVDMQPFCKNVTDAEILAVLRRCPDIKKLSLSFCRASKLHIFEALKTNSVLQVLDLSIFLHAHNAKYLCEALRMNSTLKKLMCAAARSLTIKSR